jgi:hypothetical protein
VRATSRAAGVTFAIPRRFRKMWHRSRQSGVEQLRVGGSSFVGRKYRQQATHIRGVCQRARATQP